MGFLKGGITLQRFRVPGPKPRLFDESYLETLRSSAADRDKVATADGIETGWSAGQHILDTDFTLEKNVYPDHLLFDMRTRTDKLPADRLKAYYETDLAAIVKDNPSGKPSTRQKREAKESARARLEDEAKDGRYRKWKCVPCAWDSGTNTAWFGSTSANDAQRFMNLWGQSFLTELEPINAASLAASLHPEAANETLSAFVGGGTSDVTPAWCAGESDTSFLGNEFLLWLWHFAEVASDTMIVGDGSEVTFMFSGGIEVEDPRGQSGYGTLNSSSAIRLPEAKAAVRAGKLPRKAALTVVRHSEQFSFVIQAETFALSKVKLPQPEGDGSQRERDADRLQHVRDLCETVDQMFALFMSYRMASTWEGQVREIADWLKGSRVAT